MKNIPPEAINMRKTIAMILATLSGAMAFLALLSWFTGHWQWLSLGTGCVPPAPATVILQILLSVILLTEIFGPGNAVLRRLCGVAAVLITISGLAALLRPFFGWFSPLEQWVAGTTQTIDNVPVGQMSPLTGLVFLFAGSANWAKTFRFLNKRWPRRIKFGSSGLVFWISAVVILSYVAGSPLFSDRPIIPMALWTAIIFIFLSVAMALGQEPAESPAASVTSGDKKLRAHKPFWILVSSLVALVVLAGGVVYLRGEETLVRKRKSEELAAIGKLKVDQILRWRKERISDITLFASAPLFTHAVEKWLHGSNDPILREDLVKRLELQTRTGIYGRAFLVDPDGHILLSFPETAEHAPIAEFLDIAKKAWNGSGPVISELHSDALGGVEIDIAMATRSASGQPLVVTVLTNDAKEFLFPMIQTWPLSSRTAETLLVRRDGDKVLYLNDLRHRKNTALTLRFPLTKIKVPAVQAILGKTGPVVGPDYRGIDVFSDMRPVPGTPWYLVSKVDTKEFLAEVRFRAAVIFTMTFILIAGLLGLIVLLYQVRLMKERGKAEENLRFSKYKLDLALKSARMGVWQFDLVKNKRFFDYKVYALLGIDPATFGGTAEEFFAAVHPEDRGKIREALARTIHDGVPYEPEYRVVWSDGSIRYIAGRGELVRNDQGRPEMINGIVWDITERKKTEAALRESETHYHSLFKNMINGFAYCRMIFEQGRPQDFIYLVVNDAFKNLTGLKDVENKKVSEVIPGLREADPGLLEIYGRVARTGVPERTEVYVKALKEWLDIAVYSPRQDHFVVAFDVITARKKAEEEIQRINAELEERVRQRTTELVIAVKGLETFGYSIAHDLKAPLRAMAGFANILSEDYAPKLDENAKRVIGVINDNARNMGQMIDDLLELSRTGRQVMNVADTDMTALVRSVWPMVKKGFSPDRVIELSVKPLPSARIDPILAKQIFINLISNAIKFTGRKEKAVIEIGGYDEGPERVYYVKDNGAGFDMKYENKLFGIFQRIHTQNQFEGTGIGLAIVKSAVLRHGGRVWAEGKVGQGATFYFTLPKGG